jgi:hypothetical protein
MIFEKLQALPPASVEIKKRQDFPNPDLIKPFHAGVPHKEEFSGHATNKETA